MASGEEDLQASFRRLFDDAYRPLLAYALRRGAGDADAEEVVAETLLIAWRRRQQVPAGPDTLPWLYGVARRVLANQRRAHRRGHALEKVLGRLNGSAVELDRAAELSEAIRAVVAASRRLSPEDQEVLRLAAWEGLSHHQIAVSLRCSENAAALRLHRARKRLRELLREGRFPEQDVVEVTR